MAELVPYRKKYVIGDIPWTMTQSQRGPTCGCTAIAVAYRILTGWTVFPTKGNFRQFSNDRRGRWLEKGQEHIVSVRNVAKYDDVSTAGEIVNADDMAELINDHAEGVRASVVDVEGQNVGAAFVEQVRNAFDAKLAPLVLFYIDPRDGELGIGREFDGAHWVNIYAVEKGGEWHFTAINNLTVKKPLLLTKAPKKGQMLVWSWARAWVVDGEALGKASALSVDWKTTPRLWTKDKTEENVGQLAWKEIVPDSDDYEESKPSTDVQEVRYTGVAPLRPLSKYGFVVMRNALYKRRVTWHVRRGPDATSGAAGRANASAARIRAAAGA
ncbi:MAG TPA: hypothetical protein VFS43_16545 [Polyangiaceae bacterium]|nr:hypothetical protein [Polyangiaceae bacterium]